MIHVAWLLFGSWLIYVLFRQITAAADSKPESISESTKHFAKHLSNCGLAACGCWLIIIVAALLVLSSLYERWKATELDRLYGG